jgi:hypothetical protein
MGSEILRQGTGDNAWELEPNDLKSPSEGSKSDWLVEFCLAFHESHSSDELWVKLPPAISNRKSGGVSLKIQQHSI